MTALSFIIVALALYVAACIYMLGERRAEVVQLRERIRSLKGELESALKQDAEDTLLVDAVMRASDDAIIVVDESGICRMANRGAQRLFERQDSPDGLTLLGLSHSAELDTLLRQAISDLPGARRDMTVNGEVVLWAFHATTVQAVISRVYPEQLADQPGYFVIVLRDVTELRRLSTMRRDFVANVSHELRTPLSSVRLTAETLLDGALEDTQMARHFLNTIVREAERLVRLADDLLELSRIESMPVAMAECDLSDMIEDVVARFGSQVSKAGLDIKLSLDRQLIALCDADEMSQVLLNLIDNAIKYTPSGGLVEINAKQIESWVVVEVTDTGIGILQQDIPRLFERFYRTDKARSRQSGGTGLGLAIVKHIVERHHGKLWVRSDYNHGSTFGFALPQNGQIADNPSNGFVIGSELVLSQSTQVQEAEAVSG